MTHQSVLFRVDVCHPTTYPQRWRARVPVQNVHPRGPICHAILLHCTPPLLLAPPHMSSTGMRQIAYHFDDEPPRRQDAYRDDEPTRHTDMERTAHALAPHGPSTHRHAVLSLLLLLLLRWFRALMSLQRRVSTPRHHPCCAGRRRWCTR